MYLSIICEILNAVKHDRALCGAWYTVGAQETLVYFFFEGDVGKAGLALPDVPFGVSGSGQGGVALCLFADYPLAPLFPDMVSMETRVP